MANRIAIVAKEKTPKKLREEAEMAAFRDIMLVGRRVIIDAKVKAIRFREEIERKLREEEEAREEA